MKCRQWTSDWVDPDGAGGRICRYCEAFYFGKPKVERCSCRHDGHDLRCPIHGDASLLEPEAEKASEEKEAVADNAQAVLQNALKELLKRWMKRGAGYITIRVFSVADAIQECMEDLEEVLSSHPNVAGAEKAGDSGGKEP